jgi:YVTN family beta-propeller protein
MTLSRRAALASLAATAAVPGAVAWAQTAHPIFVLNSLSGSVSVIDPLRWVEQQRLPTGKEPHHLYMTPDEKSVIVANALSDSLTFIDPRTAQVQRTVSDILDPYHLRFSPDMKWFITAANRLDHLDIYRWDGSQLSLQKRLALRETPSHIWVDSRSTTVYVTLQESDELAAIDLGTQTLKWRIPTGPMPADLYGLPGDRQMLVALTGSDAVELFDVSGREPQRLRSIRTGDGAHAFRALGDGRHVLLSNRVANTVSQIDLQSLQVVREYAVPGGPDCMDVSRDGRWLYVTSRWIARLSVVDLHSGKLARQVRVGKSPHGVWTLDHAPR